MNDHAEIARIPKPCVNAPIRFVGNDRLFVRGHNDSSCEMWQLKALSADPSKPEISVERLWRHDKGYFRGEISENHERLAIVDSSRLQVVDAWTGKVLSSFPAGPFTREPQLALHPHRPLVALYCYTHPEIHVVDWEKGKLLQVLKPDEKGSDYQGYNGVDWSPDGKTLSVVNGHEDAEHWYKLEESSWQLTLSKTVRPAICRASGGPVIRFNSKGDRLYTYGWGAILGLVDTHTEVPVFQSDPVPLLSLFEFKTPSTKSGYFSAAFQSGDKPKSLGFMSIAEGREAHVVIPSTANVGSIVACDPSGRFIVASSPSGLMLVEINTGKQLLTIPLKDLNYSFIAFDRAGNFYTNCINGVFRWPYHFTDSRRTVLEIDVPERVYLPQGGVKMAVSHDGNTIVGGAWDGMGTQEYAGSWIQTPGEPTARKIQGDSSAMFCAVAPQGNYVAASTNKLVVWEIGGERNGPVKVRELDSGARPAFCLDGKVLLGANGTYDCTDWKPLSHFENGIGQDIADDGSLILTARQDGSLLLIDGRSSRELTRIKWTDPIQYPQIIAGGSRLMFWSKGNVVVCDLSLIRSQLAELGLDWVSPSDSQRSSKASSMAKQLPMFPIESARMVPELASIKDLDELTKLVDTRALATAEKEPTDGKAVFAAAKVAIESSDYESALRLLNRCCELLPRAIGPRQWRAYLLAVMRDYAGAIGDASWVLDQSLPEPPLEEDFRLLRAEWYFQSGQYEAAIADCKLVIDRNARWSKHAYAQRSAAYTAAGQAELAADDHAKFLETTSIDATSLNMIVGPCTGTDISLRRPTIALFAARKAQSLSVPLDEEIEHGIGCALYRNDHFDESIAWFNRCLSMGKGECDGFDSYILAMAFAQTGKLDEARQAMSRAETWAASKQLDHYDRRELRILRAECERVLAHVE